MVKYNVMNVQLSEFEQQGHLISDHSRNTAINYNCMKVHDVIRTNFVTRALTQ